MTRREMREHVFKQLFLTEFYEDSEEYREECELYRQELEGMSEADLAELKDKAEKAGAAVPALDEKINKVASGWKTQRMSKVDLTLIRLALYEMEMDGNVPVRVAINEAVELAKQYGGDDSPAFVNAILGNLARELEQ